MSLKAFHLIFITASCALALGCAIWEIKNFFSADGKLLDLLFDFLKKFKDVSYL